MKRLIALIPLVIVVAAGCGSKEEDLPTQQDVSKMSSNPETNTLANGAANQGQAQTRGFGVGK